MAECVRAMAYILQQTGCVAVLMHLLLDEYQYQDTSSYFHGEAETLRVQTRSLALARLCFTYTKYCDSCVF